MGFLDELARLNQQDFLGGLAEAGTAIKEKKQNEKLVELYDSFKAKKGEADIKPTGQEMSEFQDSLNLAPDKMEGLSPEQIKTIKTLSKDVESGLRMYETLNRMQAKTDMYNSFIVPMSTLGEDGRIIANRLSAELEQDLDIERDKMDVPMKKLAYARDMVTLMGTIQQMEVNEFQYSRLKQDVATQDMLARMIQSPEVSSVLNDLRASGDTGLLGFDKEALWKKLHGKFSGDPNFGAALILLDKHLRDNYISYKAPTGDGSGLSGLLERSELTGRYFGYLDNESNRRRKWFTPATAEDKVVLDDYNAVRDGLSITDTLNRPFSDKRVIDKMVGMQEYAYSSKIASRLHDIWYNKEHEDYYWTAYGKYLRSAGVQGNSGIGQNFSITDGQAWFPLNSERLFHSYDFETGENGLYDIDNSNTFTTLEGEKRIKAEKERLEKREQNLKKQENDLRIRSTPQMMDYN